MKALIFNGSLERRPQSTPGYIANYITERLAEKQIETQIFNLHESGIPLFDVTINRTPKGVLHMNNVFLETDIHFWLAPLYHGSIPGVMKNCLDWLEVSAKNTVPYLTDKTVGLVCWADGVQAMQGINTMDTIAKALRAWPLPYSIPMVRKDIFENNQGIITSAYKDKLDRLINLAVTKKVTSTI